MPATLALLLVIRLYDAVGVPADEVAVAKQVATDILRTANIRVTWVECRVARLGAPARDGDCTTPPEDGTVMVRLIGDRLTPRLTRRGGHALGDAYVDTASGGGSLATLYVEPIRRLAEEAGTAPGRLVGRTIAHEVGHLLLGTPAHAPTGLMRAAWSAQQVQRDSGSDWLFAPNEIGEMAGNLRRRTRTTEPSATVSEPYRP